MKPNHYRYFIGILTLSLIHCGLVAQSPDPEEEEVFELSPFIVDVDEEMGYLATSTLAGTRIKTQLKDVGASISVLTPEYLEDLGGTDAGTLLNNAISTEIGGDQGVFAGGLTQDGKRVNPQYNNRIRGFSGATLSRNYFRTALPFDTYNTSSITMNRGPNSLLFGIGSAAGVIENSIKNALVDNKFGAVSFRIGERESFRGTLDYNLPVIEDRLAVRVMGMYEEINYQQEPAFEDDARYTIAATGVLYKGNDGILGPLTVRGSYENGDIDSNRPNPVPNQHHMTNWFEQPSYDLAERYMNSTVTGGGISLPNNWWMRPDENGMMAGWVKNAFGYSDGTRGPNWINIQKAGFRPNHNLWSPQEIAWLVAGREDPFFPYVTDPGAPGYNANLLDPRPDDLAIGPEYLTHAALGTTTNFPIWVQPYMIADNLANGGAFTSPSPMIAPNSVGITSGGGTNPNGTNNVFHGTQHFFYGPGWKAPTLTYDMWDNRNMLLSGNMNKIRQDFDAYNVSLDQVFRNLLGGTGGISAAFDKQDYTTDAILSFSQDGSRIPNAQYVNFNQTVRIDMNKTLFTGDDNPNFGRPFIESSQMRRNPINHIETNSWRITGFYEYDFAQHDEFLGGWFGKIMGRHVLSGVYSEFEQETPGENWHYHWTDEATMDSAILAWPGSENMNNNFLRPVRQMTYVGPSLYGKELSDFKMTKPVNVEVPVDGGVYNIYGRGMNTKWSEQQMTMRNIPFNFYNAKTIVESETYAWQGFWLGGHVVTTFGWRDDKKENYGMKYTPLDEEWEDEYLGLFGVPAPSNAKLDNTAESTFKHSSNTKSVVVHFPEKWNPFSDHVDVSFHWNEADNFNPTNTRTDINGKVVPPQIGETEEIGVSFGLLDNRLSVRLTQFETAETYVTVPGVGGGTRSQVSEQFLAMWVSAQRDLAGAENLIGETNPDTGVEFTPEELEAISFQSSWEYFTKFSDPNGSLAWSDSLNWQNYDDAIQAFYDLMPDEARENIGGEIDPETGVWVSNNLAGPSVGLQSTASEGWELDILGQITPQWSVSLSLATIETIPSGVLGFGAKDYFEEVLSELNSTGIINGGMNPSSGRPSTTIRTIITGPVSTVNGALAQEGNVLAEQSDLMIRGSSRYRFSEDSPLKGFTVGGAFRYNSESAIGYDYHVVDGISVPDHSKLHYGRDSLYGDLFIRYERDIGRDLTWKIQLNVINAYGDQDPIPWGANPDGSIAWYRNAPTREFFLTNTLLF